MNTHQAAMPTTSKLFYSVRRDFERYFANDSRDGAPRLLERVRIFVDSPGLQAVLVYRFASWVNRTFRFAPIRYPLKLVSYLLQKFCIMCWGICIDENAHIGSGLYIGHFGGVIIGPIRMGCDCNVNHQVTIGRRADGVPGVPSIGDRVWIGVGSVIFGNVQIGDGVSIAPCTVVARNLPAKVLVLGNPMRILRKDYDNSAEIYGSSQAKI